MKTIFTNFACFNINMDFIGYTNESSLLEQLTICKICAPCRRFEIRAHHIDGYQQGNLNNLLIFKTKINGHYQV